MIINHKFKLQNCKKNLKNNLKKKLMKIANYKIKFKNQLNKIKI